jgi:hypothetical protein
VHHFQWGIVRQKQAATMFHGRGQVERIERLDIETCPDQSGPLADGGSHREHGQVGSPKKSEVIRQNRWVAEQDRADEAFQAACVS